MKVTEHARKRFKQRTDIIKVNSTKVDFIPNETVDTIIKDIFKNSISVSEWIKNKQIFGALYSKQYDLIAIYCANTDTILTTYKPNGRAGTINNLLKKCKKEAYKLDNIATPMYFQIQLDLLNLKFKINYCIDNKNKDNFKKYTQEYNELLAII